MLKQLSRSLLILTLGVSGVVIPATASYGDSQPAWDFAQSSTFTVPSNGAYQIELVGGGGGGGNQNMGWVVGGGGGGGAYVSATMYLHQGQQLTMQIGAGGQGAFASLWADGNGGEPSQVLLDGSPLFSANGGSGGLGARANSGGAGGQCSDVVPTLDNYVCYRGGNGGPAFVYPNFWNGYHVGGEGGTAANSTGAGSDGSQVLCSLVDAAVVGDLPTGRGGYPYVGGYGTFLSMCPNIYFPTGRITYNTGGADSLLALSGGTGSGGGGGHDLSGGGAGGSGFGRVKFLHAITPASPPSVRSIVASSAQVTLSINPPERMGDAYIIGYEYSVDNGITWKRFSSLTGPYTISGLANGVSYQVKIRAVNSGGPGEESPAVVANPTKLVPAKPVISSITPGNASAVVVLTAPTDVTAQSITGYQFSTDGGASFKNATLLANGNVSISGLTNGVLASVRVRAVNFNGTSVASLAKSVTPATTPSAPVISSVTPSAGALSIAFAAPSTGGSAITEYQYSLDGGSTWVVPKIAVKTSPLKVTGLTNATSFGVVIRAVNAIGLGTPSTSVTASTPVVAPSAPTVDLISKAKTSLIVDVTAPVNTGGAAITNYAYSFDGTTWTPVSPASTSTRIVIGGLKSNTVYQVRIAAVNSAGVGTSSPKYIATTLK